MTAKKAADPRVYPRRKRAAERAVDWTTDFWYLEVCDRMRYGAPLGKAESTRTIMAVRAYMKHSAAVAPQIPHAVQHSKYRPPTPLVLWRGISNMAPPAVGSTIRSNGGCFTAFSYSKQVAFGFAEDGDTPFVYRLQADRIARGTPWLWFLEIKPLDTLISKEKEVLLPPGYFKVLRKSSFADVTVVDVAFIPDPEYVRRGSLPRVVGREAIARTVGGNRLAAAHPNLARRVAVRTARGLVPSRPARLTRQVARTERTARG